MRFNEKGFIVVNKDDNTRQQKGVDGYIISDLTDLSHEDVGVIALMSGDGDMKAGVEKIFERKNKRVQIIGIKDSISKELSEFCDLHYIEDEILGFSLNEKPEVQESDSNLDQMIRIMQGNEPNELTAQEEEDLSKIKEIAEYIVNRKKLRVTRSGIGLNAKKFKFNYQSRKLANILNNLQKLGKLKLTKVEKAPDVYVEFCD